MGRFAVLTSGGDAPGMNSAVWAITRVAAARGHEVVGIENGFEGLVDRRFLDLTRALAGGRLVPEDVVDRMAREGGTFLGSSRSARFLRPEVRAAAAAGLGEAGVDALLVVGGNGSLTGAHALTSETGFPVVGVPASIDNDIGFSSDAIGVDSALNTIVDACDRISDTARSHRRAFVVEVMGRDSGYLAMAAAVATGADAVLLPEQDRGFDDTIDSVADCIRASFDPERDKHRVLVIKAEGVDIPTHILVGELGVQLADIDGLEVRGTVLGHLVRGGEPSFHDRLLAGRLGLAGILAAIEGRADVMPGWMGPEDRGLPTADPLIRLYPIGEVLEETRAVLDGSSEVVRSRLARMEAIQGVLAL